MWLTEETLEWELCSWRQSPQLFLVCMFNSISWRKKVWRSRFHMISAFINRQCSRLLTIFNLLQWLCYTTYLSAPIWSSSCTVHPFQLAVLSSNRKVSSSFRLMGEKVLFTSTCVFYILPPVVGATTPSGQASQSLAQPLSLLLQPMFQA